MIGDAKTPQGEATTSAALESLKVKAKGIWTQLTEADLELQPAPSPPPTPVDAAVAECRIDKLVGQIRQRVGCSEQDIRRQLGLH